MKKHIDPFDYAGEFAKNMGKGILLTTGAGEQLNTMTIGWGHIGIEWSRPVFVAYVRESRHTKSILDECGEFTVNIPMNEIDSKILGYCGTKSGRDTNKILDLGLTLEAGETVSVPGIKELPLTLECKVIFKQEQDESILPDEIYNRYYPATKDTPNGDYHTAYYGQILNAYIVE